MKYVIKDSTYHFHTLFDTDTGVYIRTGILDENGEDTGKDPFMASFPHLIDVGIMGHCIHGQTGLCAKAGIVCYQSGMYIGQPNMPLKDFRWIARQCAGKCNQFALGGRGDPDQHEDFEKILQVSRQYNIVPNFTTSGFGMTPEIAAICKKYCGSVAVSWYRSDYTVNAIKMLLDAGVKTNIHYVVGNNTIDEAIVRLQNNDFPEGVNAVIFLLHKPAGQGSAKNVLHTDDRKVKMFYEQIQEPHPFKIGLDSCHVPGVVNFCDKVNMNSVDTCEGGRFSCYIGPDLVMSPCSFDRLEKYGVQLGQKTIEEAWNSTSFNLFRSFLKNACPNCEKREACMGGCPLMPEVVLCDRKNGWSGKENNENQE